jgi:hypothetical protein
LYGHGIGNGKEPRWINRSFAHGPDLDVTGNQKWKWLRNPKAFSFSFASDWSKLNAFELKHRKVLICRYIKLSM